MKVPMQTLTALLEGGRKSPSEQSLKVQLRELLAR
jgi:hypothetical protein